VVNGIKEVHMWRIVVLVFMLSTAAKAGDCTSISRTNSSPFDVLSSTKYNADLNTVYSAANSLDGGCITDGTLEAGALNTTEFNALLNAPKVGCNVTRSDNNTLQIDRCKIFVNGESVQKTTTTSVTWGCPGCASEIASQTYYLYVANGSTGTTLNGLISTTAPNGDGYDGSNNRALAVFYNDASSNITKDVVNWVEPGFSKVANSSNYSGGLRIEICDFGSDTGEVLSSNGICDGWIVSLTEDFTGRYNVVFKAGVFKQAPVCTCTATANHFCTIGNGDMSAVTTFNGVSDVRIYDDAGSLNGNQEFALICIGERNR
jgi:hypothetical protein